MWKWVYVQFLKNSCRQLQMISSKILFRKSLLRAYAARWRKTWDGLMGKNLACKSTCQRYLPLGTKAWLLYSCQWEKVENFSQFPSVKQVFREKWKAASHQQHMLTNFGLEFFDVAETISIGHLSVYNESLKLRLLVWKAYCLMKETIISSLLTQRKQ